MQESIKDEVAGKSRYAGESFALGWIFPGGDRVLMKGSEELLWISHVVPLPRVVHKGEVSPAPVIVDVWKEEGFLMQSNKEKCGSHFGVISELPRSCSKW